MILVVSSKTAYASLRLVEEAQNLSIPLKIIGPEEASQVNPNEFDVLYVRNPYFNQKPDFLSDIINLAKKFKASGKKVVDSVIAEGNLGLGKEAVYSELQKANLSMPKTEGLKTGTLAFPKVIKWIYGFRGQHVFLIENNSQLEEITKKYPFQELLSQEYVPADFEYKVITVGYKSLPVVVRFNIQASGFKIEHDEYEVIQSSDLADVVSLAEKSAQVLGRELSKVDILESGGKYYVLDVNRFPGLESFEKLSKHNVVRSFLEYLQA